jgi:hypothetical protein
MVGALATRDGAAAEAHRELSRAIYHEARPDRFQRALAWITDRLNDLWTNATQASGHGLGMTAVMIALILVIGIVWLRFGPVRRHARAASTDLFLDSQLSAAALRAEADGLARTGAFAEAVRSRLRAIVRMLEETGVLEPRPGRTAGELVTEVARIDSGKTPVLEAAVTVFSEIWYGGIDASAGAYQLVVRADEALTGMRPRPAGGPAPTFAVPA